MSATFTSAEVALLLRATSGDGRASAMAALLPDDVFDAAAAYVRRAGLVRAEGQRVRVTRQGRRFVAREAKSG